MLDYNELLELSRLQASKLLITREKDKRIRLVKLTKKQSRILATSLIYFMKLHERAMTKVTRSASVPNPYSILDGEIDAGAPRDYIEPIPLTKLYNMFNCNTLDRQAVQVAANAFFKPLTRGNFKTGKCSGWEPRKEPQFNPTVKKMLLELFQQNEAHIDSVSTYVNTKDSEIDNVAVTTTFKFASQEQAKNFVALMTQISFESDDVRVRAPKTIKLSDVNKIKTDGPVSDD